MHFNSAHTFFYVLGIHNFTFDNWTCLLEIVQYLVKTVISSMIQITIFVNLHWITDYAYNGCGMITVSRPKW